jgi:hypothetical protein
MSKANKTQTQLKYVFWIAIAVLIGLGIYSKLARNWTGGALYSRFGGSTSVAYSSNGFFIMAAILIVGALWVTLYSRIHK